jgi:HlyD family secretion protein
MRLRIVFISFLLCALSACDGRDRNPIQGYVEAENLYLASPFPGVLLELAVMRGDKVKQGQLVFKLNPAPESLKFEEGKSVLLQEKEALINLQTAMRPPEIEMAQARLTQVEERIKLAALRMKRFRELYEKKAGTLDESDAATHRFTELEALKVEREEALKLAKMGARDSVILTQKAKLSAVSKRLITLKWNVDQKSLSAPADGIIFDTFFIEGEWVPDGKPVAALLILDEIRIDFFVPARRLAKLRLGQTVDITCVGCPRKSKAKIVYISPEAEYVPPLVYSRKNYDKLVFRIQAKPLKPEAFKPGQPVTVSGF